jgi:hypothetical protein
MDLAGGGLQSANIRLARLLKRRRIAYALLLLFPVGAHRAYLEDRRGALLYCMGSAVAVLSLATGATLLGGALGAVLIGGALLDVRWIESTVARINKRLRVEVYMSQTPGAPAGYKGRFPVDGASADDTPRDERASSFAVQEQQLRDAAARRHKSRQ